MLEVTIYPQWQIEFTSQLYAGLYELRAQGEIELHIGDPRDVPDAAFGLRNLVPLTVRRMHGDRPVRVLFDLNDGVTVNDGEHRAWADVYFKAAVQAGTPPDVLPLGLRYACTSRHERIMDRVRFGIATGRKTRQLLTHPVHVALAKVPAMRNHSRIPPRIETFEVPPEAPADPQVFYRTRVYTLDDAPNDFDRGEFHKVNEFRVATIRALREHLGPAFIGGIRPTPYALESYPDLVMQEAWDWRRHLEVMKRSLICVTTAGLFDSIDWKIAEYMAASRCIVTERLKMVIPEPVVEGQELLTFDDPADSVAQCVSVLENPDRAMAMRASARHFYDAYVEPSSIMRNRLNEAVATMVVDAVA